MLVDLNQRFVNTDGRIVKDITIIEDEKGNTRKVINDLTLERIVNLALAEPVDQNMSGDNKIKCFDLILKVLASNIGMVELVSDDIAFIKNLIKPKFGPIVVGEAMRMLEGKDIGIEIIDEIPIADQDVTKPELEPGMSVEDLIEDLKAHAEKDTAEKHAVLPELSEDFKKDLAKTEQEVKGYVEEAAQSTRAKIEKVIANKAGMVEKPNLSEVVEDGDSDKEPEPELPDEGEKGNEKPVEPEPIEPVIDSSDNKEN